MDIGSLHLESQELYEGLAAIGAVGLTTVFGLLFVSKARATRRRQIEESDEPVARVAGGKRGKKALEPEPEEEEEEPQDVEPLAAAAPQRKAPLAEPSGAPEHGVGSASPAKEPVIRPPGEPKAPAAEARGPAAQPAAGRAAQILPFPTPASPAQPRGEERRQPPPVEPAPEPAEAPAPRRKKNALAPGLAKTRSGWVSRLGNLFAGKREIDPGLLDEMEKVLLTADIGVRTANKLLEEMRASLSRRELANPEAAWTFLEKRSLELLSFGAPPVDWKAAKPMVLLIIGVNGSGKTTTIGKLAAKLVAEGKKVLVGAGDTFRAAAAEQLDIWANRVGATLVRGKEGADPSSVLFDAVKRATTDGFEVVIADTAGRLHTKTDLMEELQKVRRVIGKAAPGAPHETWLVIDSTSGQNAIAQAQIFTQAMSVSGIVLTKLDGTAKGGVILGIADQLHIPVRFIGIGERVEDLREFDAAEFVEALFERDDSDGTASASGAN
jgi:fused signal recognition particle receptor